jgi:prepilin-type N-terminal cleavage/methylation domain-containing protein
MRILANKSKAGGFTLVEVVISIGVLAIALSVIIASIAFSSSRGAENSRKIQALTLAETVVTDLRGALNNSRATSVLLGVAVPATPPVAATKEVFFNAEGVQVAGATGAFFKCTLTYNPDAGVTNLVHVNTRVIWPAMAKVGSEQGAVELLNSFSLK